MTVRPRIIAAHDVSPRTSDSQHRASIGTLFCGRAEDWAPSSNFGPVSVRSLVTGRKSRYELIPDRRAHNAFPTRMKAFAQGEHYTTSIYVLTTRNCSGISGFSYDESTTSILTTPSSPTCERLSTCHGNELVYILGTVEGRRHT